MQGQLKADSKIYTDMQVTKNNQDNLYKVKQIWRTYTVDFMTYYTITIEYGIGVGKNMWINRTE